MPDSVSRETGERLSVFLDLLTAWNAHINLVSAAAPDEWWTRHIEDCGQLAPLMPAGTIADLGSGAGLPGLILAATLTDQTFHLVEADARKCAFLREARRVMRLTNVEIHHCRIEHVALPALDGLTARALAPLPQLLIHAHRLLAPTGSAIFPKGKTAESELTACAPHWHMTVQRFASRTDRQAAILRITELRPA